MKLIYITYRDAPLLFQYSYMRFELLLQEPGELLQTKFRVLKPAYTILVRYISEPISFDNAKVLLL